MPLVQNILRAEEETFSYYTARGEFTESNFCGVPITVFKPKTRDNYFYKTRPKKLKIVLHYTIGYVGGDIANLSRDNFHVSVPFLIARSGRIIQLYDPDYWSYHLSKGAVGGNKTNSSQSVPIELTGMGPLDKSGGWMFNYYGSRYCRVSETQHYFDNKTAYRGYRYFTRFTGEQYTSLARLLPAIGQKYNIPITFLPLNQRYSLFKSANDARAYSGICSHVNFQPATVKNDIGPAFDWGKING